MNRLQGKVALVSGGARGIGEGIVRRFVAEGAQVMIADLLDGEGRALAASLGKAASFHHLDVTSRTDWEATIAATVAHFGQLNCVVNNAGVLIFKRFEDHDDSDVSRLIDVNLKGVILGCQAAIPALEQSGGGSIINLSSADGISPANAVSIYSATKFAVRGLTRALALELGPRGIRVNSIHPGGINTPLANPTGVEKSLFDQNFRVYPAQMAGDPSDIGAAAAYLASDDARYCMGTELVVDGGMCAGHYYMGLPGAPG